MAPQNIKPLVSEQREPSSNNEFKHFGVLDTGQQGKGSVFTSVTVNILIALIVCLVGAAAKKTIERHKMDLTYVPTEQPKPKPPKPLIKPPKLPPPPPEAKLEPPKIKIPDLKVPEPPKLPEIKPAPVPIKLPPAPPKLVVAPPAPKPVNLGQKPQAAAIANNTVAAPIRLGQMDNPIKTTGPAVSAINLGQAGAKGMPASNTGLGAVSKVNLGGNGQPNGSMNGNGVRAVQGVRLGVQGGTGPMNSTGRTAAVNLGSTTQPTALPKAPVAAAVSAGKPPKILSQPKPVYTAEATAKHVEGVIMVRVRLTASGSVEVLSISHDLGYGLGHSAMQAVQGIRFQPATDAEGRPVDWTGEVRVLFEIAG